MGFYRDRNGSPIPTFLEEDFYKNGRMDLGSRMKYEGEKAEQAQKERDKKIITYNPLTLYQMEKDEKKIKKQPISFNTFKLPLTDDWFF